MMALAPLVLIATAIFAQHLFPREQMGNLCDIGAIDTADAIEAGASRYVSAIDGLSTCRLTRLTVATDWRTLRGLMKGPELPPDTAPGAVWAWRKEAINGPVLQIWSMGTARATVQIRGGTARTEGTEGLDRALFGTREYSLLHFSVNAKFSELFVRVTRGNIDRHEAYRICRLLEKRLGLVQHTSIYFGREPFFIDSDSFPSNHPGIVRSDLTYQQSKHSYLTACSLRREWRCP